MTETEIQNFAYIHIKGTGVICPNVYLYQWESDLVFVNQNNFVIEYEIKISRSDFKADLKKKDRHMILEKGERSPDTFEKMWMERDPDGWTNKNLITESGNVRSDRPNRFYYLCPEGIIKPEDLPKHAGLFWIKEISPKYRILERVKMAPLLHKDKITENQMLRLLHSLRFKYWALRLNKPEKELEALNVVEDSLGMDETSEESAVVLVQAKDEAAIVVG